MVFEVIVMSSAFASTGLTMLCAAVCCTMIIGSSARYRHTSRMLGTKLRRVDKFPWKQHDLERRGFHLDGALINPEGVSAHVQPEPESTGGLTFRWASDALAGESGRYWKFS